MKRSTIEPLTVKVYRFLIRKIDAVQNGRHLNPAASIQQRTLYTKSTQDAYCVTECPLFMALSVKPSSIISTSIPVMDPEDGVSVKSASPGLAPPSAGMKRKRAPEPKFYAVRVGVKPGIYSSWKECLEQVKGFKNAICEHLLLT